MARSKKVHPALKHAAYSATTLLPGENAAAFDRLRQGLIDELAPNGALEDDILDTLARLLWRKQHLSTFRMAQLARGRYSRIVDEKCGSDSPLLLDFGPRDPESVESADAQARGELGGDMFALVELGNRATVQQLLSDLAIEERLDALIDKCLKRMLFLRGLKSLAQPQTATPTPAP